MSLVIDLEYSVSETALRLSVAQSWHWVDTERTALGGKPTGDIKIEPFANAAYVHQRIGGFNESGGAATLSVDDPPTDIGLTSLGVRGSHLMTGRWPCMARSAGGLPWET
ncbi:autotransporter outer membrane beta-barrel domain-containing protein [Halomonas korlensis]|uniref:Autotransporter beta-domain-containing protein n=1 Tax=Halomonas korlensis TaxID=463301 RepID=A0A1I7GJY4_9GAMM|nr:autotransporter outer membrane beta-barrel domain-containing protein [Halomonas korlensis]SFU48753.1 Autotransporter beta-domain-containing protein [Halomonas korlensis]